MGALARRGSEGDDRVARSAVSCPGFDTLGLAMTNAPTVSVVIPTYNRSARLERVLTALSTQTYDPARFEVVVVSDGSSDGTDEYLARARTPFDLVVVSQSNAGPAAARNRGVQLARAPLVLFVDDDVIATAELIDEHVATHARQPADTVVIGPMLTPPDFQLSAWIEWEQTMLYKQYDAMARGVYAPTYRQFYTGNASVSRLSILAIGGFDVRYRRAEDVELAYRLSEAGARFVFNDRAISYHYAERSFHSWLQNARDYGTNDVIFAGEHARSHRLQSARDDFRNRHRLIRAMTRSCVVRPWLTPIAEWQLRGLAQLADRVWAKNTTRFALSGLYNLSYYSAMAEAMGGARAFLQLVDDQPNLGPA
jgi:glycosyltransferase involved in cell wall biosynthesis